MQEASALRRRQRSLQGELGKVQQQAAARAAQLEQTQAEAEAARQKLELERSRAAVLDKAYKSARAEAEVGAGS